MNLSSVNVLSERSELSYVAMLSAGQQSKASHLYASFLYFAHTLLSSESAMEAFRGDDGAE